MGFWLTFFLYVGFTVLTEILRPKPKFGAPAPSSLGDFDVPTAVEGRAIPVIFGTCKVAGPNVVWYGDLVTKAATKNVKTGLFSSDNIVIAYLYHLGAMLVLCHGEVDDVLEVRFDDRPVPGGGFVVNAANKGVAFGQIPSETVQVGQMIEGTYQTGGLLAAESERAMNAEFGANHRCVYGFHVIANVSDKFIYAVRRSSDNLFDADTIATIAVGNYDAAGFAVALFNAIVAAEALIGGGPRITPAVGFAGGLFGGGSQIKITFNPARSGYNGWKVRGSAVNYLTSALPLIGAKMGFDKTIGSLPGTYVAPNAVGAERFMFAKETEIGKLLTADPGFTSADLLGLDRTPASGTTKYAPNHTWTQGWGVFGYGGANAMSTALSDGSDGTYGRAGGGEGFGDLCAVYGTNVQLAPVLDPGDTATATFRLRAQRFGSESAGTVSITAELYAGQPPVDDGGDGSVGTLIKTQIVNPGFGAGWVQFEVTLSASELTNFRNSGGFTTGARVRMLASSSGLGNCNLKGVGCSLVELEVTNPNYKIIRHHRGYREVATTGLLFTDLGNGKIAIDINQPTLFGGVEREGGVKGRIDFYKGTLTQVANDYLISKLGVVDLPAYRGISYAVLRGLYVGTSPYLKSIGFVLRRLPNQLGLTAGRHNINGDANPAAMLYEVLTNDRWGLGIPAAQVNAASFVAAGDLLYAESFGLSMTFDSASPARDLISEILRHIDGVLYTDPQSGLLTLTLARENYGPGDPLLLDESNIDEVRIGRPAWDETKNVVKLTYVDRAGNFSPRVVQEQDLANVQIIGGLSEESYDFRGISNATLAQQVAARVLKTVSYPLAPIELKANRKAWRLRPGSVARLRWPALGIVDMAVRITRIGTGTLKRGQITVDAVEDVFGVSGTGYPAPAASGWVDPIVAPVGLADSRLVECPYALVVGADRVVLALGAQASSPQLGFQVWTDPSGGSLYALTNEVRELTPSGTVTTDVDYVDQTIRLAGVTGVALLDSASDADFAAGRNVALIGQEFVAWQFISDNGDGTFTLSGVVRGVADTVPARHVAGTRVWFVTDGAGLASRSPYGSDVNLSAKLLAFTALGVQDLDDVVAVTLATTSRAQRPYVPRSVKVAGDDYPIMVPAGVLITVSWKHRNRLAEWSWEDGGETSGIEAGQTYTLKFYGEDGLLKKTYSGLTSTSQTWDSEVADAGAFQQAVRITLESVVGSLVSFQMFDLTVYRSVVTMPRMVELPIGAGRSRAARRRVLIDSGAAE